MSAILSNEHAFLAPGTEFTIFDKGSKPGDTDAAAGQWGEKLSKSHFHWDLGHSLR